MKDFKQSGVALAALFLATAGLTSGCVATRKYVRNQVDTSSTEITTRMEEKDKELENGIQTNSGQITELSNVSREHTQKIGTLDTGLKATDEKAAQAVGIGQNAQSTATQAVNRANVLDQKFQNRNNYAVLSEDSIPFQFGSSKLDTAHLSSLEQIAQQIKSNPNAILVLEGHTDSAGDETYNIQLGEQRLESVIRYLVVEQGVPMHQVYKMSFGEERPVSENNTREGRAQNRSVVVRLMGPTSDAGTGGQIMSDAAPTR
jgi:outer membrane protein OmpA-like peptidoglycan-associated protein